MLCLPVCVATQVQVWSRPIDGYLRSRVALHPTSGSVAFHDDHLLDVEWHVGGGWFCEGAEDAHKGQAGIGWDGASRHDDPFPIVTRKLGRASDAVAGVRGELHLDILLSLTWDVTENGKADGPFPSPWPGPRR